MYHIIALAFLRKAQSLAVFDARHAELSLFTKSTERRLIVDRAEAKAVICAAYGGIGVDLLIQHHLFLLHAIAQFRYLVDCSQAAVQIKQEK